MERPRRLRLKDSMRRLVAETAVQADDLVMPLFVHLGSKADEIDSLPGIRRETLTTVVKEAKKIYELGIPAVLLFGIAEKKSVSGDEGWSSRGAIQQAVAAIKKAVPELLIITDVCLCAFTNHGHCGILKKSGAKKQNPEVDYDLEESQKALAKIAVSHAQAGADVVAPSAMVDGQVAAIREALDSQGFGDVSILSYSVKYASGFYGPFRDAAGSSPDGGDRKSYQMSAANRKEALREARLDIEEGADMIMVKPALAYLDVIRDLADSTDVPLAAYSVSGEYACVEAAAEKNWVDRESVIAEILTSIRRAGAQIIITYWAKEAAATLLKNRK